MRRACLGPPPSHGPINSLCHGVARDSHSDPRPVPKLCQLDLMSLPYGPHNDENITGYADITDMKKMFSNSALALKQAWSYATNTVSAT